LKTNKSYKYINLLIRIIIGIAAVWFIYLKLADTFLGEIKNSTISYGLVFIALLLLLLNWGIEAIKWRYAIKKVDKISIFQAFKITITGITAGLITPNRIGEIPARALLLDKGSFKEVSLKTAVASFSQVIITLLIGGISFAIAQKEFQMNVKAEIVNSIIIFSVLILFFLYFRIGKWESVLNKISYFREKEIFKALSEFSYLELFNILILSLLRYVVFSLQYWLVLKAFGISLNSLNEIILIPVCFLFTSLVPTILISEIGVRGSVALFVFGIVSGFEVQIVLASVLVWLINVALPALFGLLNLRSIKILREN
jgi:lysylphosphatidylglycerol synthase-like protein